MPPNVVLLKSNLGAQGGLEKYTLRLAKAFAEHGINTSILTTHSRKNALPSTSVPLHPLFKETKFSVGNLYRFDRACTQWLKKNPAQIIFGLDRNRHQTHYRAGNGVHAAYLERRAKQESYLKRISFSINPLHRTLLSFEKTAFEDPNLQILFTNSHMVKNEILSHYKTDPAKIQVVHNGVEWHEYQSDFDTWQQMRPTSDALQLLFVGHEYKRKGLALLLEALSLVKDKPIHLSVLGKDRNQAFFEHLANQLGVQATFFGIRKDVRSFYQTADALVIPSLYDPFANVTVEALAMGLFVLSSPFNGGSEVINAHSGLILNNLFDREEFAHKLRLIPAKTTASAALIRDSVRPLDFKNQLNTIVHHATRTLLL